MTPKIATEVTAVDKTGKGLADAERSVGRFAKKTDGEVKKSGLARLGQQIDKVTKLRNVGFGFDGLGKGLSTLGEAAGAVKAGLTGAAEAAGALGLAGEGAFAGLAAGAASVLGPLAVVGVSLGAIGAATYKLGSKWAGLGSEVDRTSRTIGESAENLQIARAAAERFGVPVEATTASLDGLATSLYDAKYGANNLALGALTQLGVKLKQTKDGAVDVYQAMLDISDAIARQKNPQTQKRIADIFGMGAMLPALRQGSKALKAEGADYQASGAVITAREAAKSSDVLRKTTALRQNLSALEKKLGMGAETATGAMADAGLTAARSTLGQGARDLASGGTQAGRSLIDGGAKAAREIAGALQGVAAPAGAGGGGEPGQSILGMAGRAAGAVDGGVVRLGRALGGAFEDFARRIEHQESRGRQFDRSGRPLTSSAGAVGVMQVLPETARAAARRAGVAWDPERFKTDAAYNRMLGQSELQRLTEKYAGDQVLAAAAYNAGEGRLDGYRDKRGVRHPGWLERYGDPRKGEISDQDFARKIPFRETREYVANTAAPKAHVEITLKGAPPGTVAKVGGAPGVNVDMRVARTSVGVG